MIFMFILQIILVVAIRETTALPNPTCFNSNWWASFDKKGWSTCNNNQRYITGFYRSKLGGWNNDQIYRLEEAKCCVATPAVYQRQAGVCVNANWWASLDKRGTWSVCPTGYFLNGLYRTTGNNLHNIESGRCCKPQHHPLRYGQCYDEDIRHKFDKAGWTVCTRAGYFVAGLYRDTGTDWLHNVDKFRCCQMSIASPTCINSNWWASFDKKGWSTCKSNQRYITGFYRSKLGSWSKDEIYRLEEAKCCVATPAVYQHQAGVCVNANWWASLDKRGTWSVCPTGYFLNGLYRTKGNNLHNIEEGRCCKPQQHPLRYGQCYDENIRHKFDKAGWTVCSRAGYFVAGLYRDTGTDWLHNVDKFRCCQMTFNPKPTCFNANWWASFDKKGWSTCNNNQRFITGFYRTKLGRWSKDEIYRLEEAKCCGAPAPYTGEATRCVNANWWASLDKRGTWSKCQKGYFLSGLYRTSGQNLHNIEQGRCCKPQRHPLRYGQCYEENIRHKFDKAGWSVCTRAGYFVVGLYRDTGTDWLHNVDKLYCCKMTSKLIR